MGGGSFNASAYRSYASSTQGKSTSQVFTQKGCHVDLNPKGVKVRESRDSADSPESIPIIIALDVTGSMGEIARLIAAEGLGVLFNEILDKRPVKFPHIMFMAVGDANTDQVPLQVSQFEADNRVVEQLTKIYVEGNGGGNGSESYHLPWYFAANHTSHDAYVKRGRRGYLFTIGDEETPPPLTRDQILAITGDTVESEQSAADLLAEVQRTYDVFHIVIKEGNHCRGGNESNVLRVWRALMGEHVIPLGNYKELPKTIVAAIALREGMSRSTITVYSDAVQSAVKNLPAGKPARPMLAASN